MSRDKTDLAAFLNACASGDVSAQRRFHEVYGEDIYNFPIKICGAPSEEAGDFYLYVFDDDRIFFRLKTFAGRNNIQFRTFLSYYVLKHLFIEWQRTRKEIETISLQTPIADDGDGTKTLEDTLPSSLTTDCTDSEYDETCMTTITLNSLTPEDQLYLKLLSLLEYHLSSEDVRLLAQISERTVEDTLLVLAEVYNNLKHKDEHVASLCSDLDAVWGWIVQRQKEIQTLSVKLSTLSTVENPLDTEKWRAQKLHLEHALARRLRQRERLVEKLQTYKLTTPYHEIARLLNTTTTGVYARICYLREHLMRALSERRSLC